MIILPITVILLVLAYNLSIVKQIELELRFCYYNRVKIKHINVSIYIPVKKIHET